MKKLLIILMSVLVVANTFAGDSSSSSSSSAASEGSASSWYSAPADKITSGTTCVFQKINDNKLLTIGLITSVIVGLVAYKYGKAIAKRLKKDKTSLVG